MKTVDIELGGQKWAMPVCYAASSELSEIGHDPLLLSFEASKGPLQMTGQAVVDILAVGLKHAGCSWTNKQIGEHVVEQGVMENYVVAINYVMALVSGGPSKPTRQGSTSKKKPVAGTKS